MPNMTAIIVTYNSAESITACVESLRREGVNKIVFVDNASYDTTKDIIQQSITSQDILVENKTNAGFSAGVNIGLSYIHDGYVLLLNPDAWLKEGALAKALSVFSQRTDVGAVGLALVDKQGYPQSSFGWFPSFWRELRQIIGWSKWFGKGRYARYVVEPVEFQSGYKDWVSGGAMVFSKEIADMIGFFDKQFFLYMEDVDWCKRMAVAGIKVWYEQEAKVVHSQHGSSPDSKKAWKEEIRSVLLYYGKWNIKWRFLLKLILSIRKLFI
ncbi:MAG: glycosyltransferase family 2 protein [bacterium]